MAAQPPPSSYGTNSMAHYKETETLIETQVTSTLQWRHNGPDGVSIISLTIVYSAVYSGAGQRNYQSSASLAFVRGIHR